jgi:FkbH-like protein
MLIIRTDLVAAKVDWNEKSQNIRALARDLDLNVNSFVFWDDNPIEREKARLAIPEMLTVDVPNEIHHWPSLLETMFEFSRFHVTDEDRKKTTQYEARYKFIESKSKALDENSFLRSIVLKGELIKLSESNITRAIQLCQKTNQFNLTTRRYSHEELNNLSNDDFEFCMLAKLTDRFSDHGLVGLVCLRELNSQTLLLENLLLSCRVLGRKFEFWIMDQIISLANRRGYTELLGLYLDSGKNTVSKDYLSTCGFLLAESTMERNQELGKLYSDDLQVFTRDLRPLDCFKRELYES